MVVGCYAGFHFSTLEEYYVGTLHLPKFNAVTDGSFLIVIGFIAIGVAGPSAMSKPICGG
jgi:hypothetical protein